jgi:hypothetical protein
MSKIKVDETDPQITKWEPIVAALAVAAGVPVPVAMAWQAIESGGNPAATGELTATGPDGAPREIGLFQIYNPDDFKALGANPLELVAYTVRPAPGARTQRDDDGGYKDGTLRNPQRLARPMTPAEITRHVQLGINLINLKRHYADRYLAENGITWPTTSPDYWAAVKAPHAWPPIINTGLAKVTKYLGRPPISWKEFRSTYEIVEPRAKFDPVKAAAHPPQQQSPYYRGLENAEWVGFHVSPAAVA